MNKLKELKQYINDNKINLKSQERERVYPRHYCAFYLYTSLGLTDKQVGEVLNIHRCTVLNSIKVHKELVSYSDKGYLNLTKELRYLFPVKDENYTVIILNEEQQIKLNTYKVFNNIDLESDAILSLIDKMNIEIEL